MDVLTGLVSTITGYFSNARPDNGKRRRPSTMDDGEDISISNPSGKRSRADDYDVIFHKTEGDIEEAVNRLTPTHNDRRGRPMSYGLKTAMMLARDYDASPMSETQQLAWSDAPRPREPSATVLGPSTMHSELVNDPPLIRSAVASNPKLSSLMSARIGLTSRMFLTSEARKQMRQQKSEDEEAQEENRVDAPDPFYCQPVDSFVAQSLRPSASVEDPPAASALHANTDVSSDPKAWVRRTLATLNNAIDGTAIRGAAHRARMLTAGAEMAVRADISRPTVHYQLLPAQRTAVDGYFEQFAAMKDSQASLAHVVGRCGSDFITFANLGCLRPNTWLNDEVINFHLARINVHASIKPPAESSEALLGPLGARQRARTHAWSTHFLDKLKSTTVTDDKVEDYSYDAVRSWSIKRGLQLNEVDLILVPVHSPAHWALIVINMHDRLFHIYDSLGRQYPEVVDVLRRWVHDETADKLGADHAVSADSWHVLNYGDRVPQQLNGVDCGCFLIGFAKCIAAGEFFDFSQDCIADMRYQYAFEIIETS